MNKCFLASVLTKTPWTLRTLTIEIFNLSTGSTLIIEFSSSVTQGCKYKCTATYGTFLSTSTLREGVKAAIFVFLRLEEQKLTFLAAKDLNPWILRPILSLTMYEKA